MTKIRNSATDQPGTAAGHALNRRQLLAATAGLAALAPMRAALASQSSGLRMFMVPKWTTFPYFKAIADGARKVADEIGGTLTYTGPTSPNAEQQVASLENVLVQQPDVILLSAIQQKNVAPVLKKAMSRGVVVVTYDADAAADARNLYCNQLSYDMAGRAYLDAALADDPAGGEIVFMAASPTAVNHVQQIKAMERLIASDAKYKVFKPGKTYYCNDDVSQSYNTMVNIMQAQPNVKYMASGSAVSVPAAQQAIVATGHAGKVWATGCAMPSDCKKFLEDGSAKAFVIWSPNNLGYMAAYAAYLIKTKKFEPKVGAELAIPSLGNFPVAKSDVVNLNQPLTLTKENVGKYDF